jgi:hypothetical protein
MLVRKMMIANTAAPIAGGGSARTRPGAGDRSDKGCDTRRGS